MLLIIKEKICILLINCKCLLLIIFIAFSSNMFQSKNKNRWTLILKRCLFRPRLVHPLHPSYVFGHIFFNILTSKKKKNQLQLNFDFYLAKRKICFFFLRRIYTISYKEQHHSHFFSLIKRIAVLFT